MKDLYSQILGFINQSSEYITNARRSLHQIPELGFEEVKTAAFIARELENMGLAPKCGIVGTGITASLSFARPGPTIMLRADMDALPVQEETGLSFASQHPGKMHACGHDGHVAMLLGAAQCLVWLSKTKEAEHLCGKVLFLFQPAEEAPGGALPMIEAGVLQGVDFCLGSHIWPEIPEGTVGVRKGPLMAAVDRFDITLRGRGGHGSQPHLVPDVLDAAAQLTAALQHVVSRRVNPVLPAVLTVGCLQAGHTYNVIPETARIMGCTRAFHPEVCKAWQGYIQEITEGICQSKAVSFDLLYQPGHGAVNNDEAITALVAKAASLAVGDENVVEPELSLAGEDFSCYQDVIPGCMFFVGAGTPDGKPLHSPHFAFNEQVLLNGTKVFSLAALEILGAKAAS